MLVTSFGAAVTGIDAIRITIEASVIDGLGFTIVGLPDTAVKESCERVRSALSECGIDINSSLQVIVNMSPADVRKVGSAYDLPIALGIAAATGAFPPERLTDYMIMGELSLGGAILPVRGALPMAIEALNSGMKGIIVPRRNVSEAAVVNKIEVLGADTLRQLIMFFRGDLTIEPTVVDTRAEFEGAAQSAELDFADVKGQENAVRALQVASAGGHNLLMVGPPGAGKSMMAKRIPSILPPLTLREALETTKIHSVAGTLPPGSHLMVCRPYRDPHHSISPVALVGGGNNPMPGEISLAHNGVLFLDELPEFPRTVLEVMRQPLEDRTIKISRAKYNVTYPAGFMLIAAMNPCPCGYYNHPTKECTCSPGAIRRYMSRVSGPLLDRMDIHVEILPVDIRDLIDAAPSRTSSELRAEVIRAREIQAERFKNETGIFCNAQMNDRMLNLYAPLSKENLEMLTTAIERFKLSARAYSRIRKVARTIADLAGSAEITRAHILEAISYRTLDRSSWGTVL